MTESFLYHFRMHAGRKAIDEAERNLDLGIRNQLTSPTVPNVLPVGVGGVSYGEET